MANKKIQFDQAMIERMVGDAMAKVMKEKTLPKYRDIARTEFVKEDVHPRAWKESAAQSIEDGDAWFDPSTMEVYGNLRMGHDEEFYQDVRLDVLEDGNNHHGPLYTEPGKISWNANLTEKHQQNHTLNGRPVVWVHNSDPTLTKTIYRYSKREKRMKSYTAKVGKFYPLFGKTYLPDEFNREGFHVMEHVCDNAQKILESRPDTKQEFVSSATEQIKESISNSNKT